MTPQQAGVSATQVREIFANLTPYPDTTNWQAFADRLNALATAPAEQGIGVAQEEAQLLARYDKALRDQPQAASVGALGAEQVRTVFAETPPTMGTIYWIEMWQVTADRLNALLAAHDQKVRAEVLANILPLAILEAWHDGYQDGIADGAPYPSQQDIDELQRRILVSGAGEKEKP